MANQIEREAWVKQDKLKNPIHYVRGTDLLPIVFHFRDFTIPSGATARVFVAKPDGNAVYDSATIEGNDVTVDVTEQMFLVLGMTLMQISIFDGEEELVTFAQPVMVEQNLKAGDFPESTTDVSFLDDAIEQANQAVNTATTAASQAAQAVQNANQAIEDANDAISDLNAQIASLNTNFASLANNVSISQLQTTAKTLVGGINELNSKSSIGRTLSDDINIETDNFDNGVYWITPSTLGNPSGSNGRLVKMDNYKMFVSAIATSGIYYARELWVSIYVNSTWTSFNCFSDDATLFTPQDITITDGNYGHVNGNFKRIGSLLVFSFWITLTKEYIGASHDPLFTFDSIKSSGRYDIPIFQSYSFGKPVAALFVNNGDNPYVYLGNGADLSLSSGTLFCSGTMIVTDK